MGEKWNWIGPASGLLAAALFVLSRTFGGWHIPGALGIRPEDAPDAIGTAFAENTDSFRAGAHLGFLAALFLIIFVADLRRRMAQREGPSGTWGLLAFGGGIIFSVIIIMQNSLTLAARVVGTEGLSPEIAQMILAVHWSGSDLLAAPVAAVVFGVSAHSLSTELLPRWMAWAGIALTAGVVVTLAVPTDSPLFIFVGLSLLWVAVSALVLLLSDIRPAGTGQQPAAAPS